MCILFGYILVKAFEQNVCTRRPPCVQQKGHTGIISAGTCLSGLHDTVNTLRLIKGVLVMTISKINAKDKLEGLKVF